MYYQSLQTHAFFDKCLTCGPLLHWYHPRIWILTDPEFYFLRWQTSMSRLTDVLQLASSNTANTANTANTPAAGVSLNISRNTSMSQTHKHTLTASSDASSCYRNTNTSITSAYADPTWLPASMRHFRHGSDAKADARHRSSSKVCFKTQSLSFKHKTLIISCVKSQNMRFNIH